MGVKRDQTTWNSGGVFFPDGPHGVRKQEGEGDHLGLNASVPATCFPTAATIANSWDESLVKRLERLLEKKHQH